MDIRPISFVFIIIDIFSSTLKRSQTTVRHSWLLLALAQALDFDHTLGFSPSSALVHFHRRFAYSHIIQVLFALTVTTNNRRIAAHGGVRTNVLLQLQYLGRFDAYQVPDTIC